MGGRYSPSVNRQAAVKRSNTEREAHDATVETLSRSVSVCFTHPAKSRSSSASSVKYESPSQESVENKRSLTRLQISRGESVSVKSDISDCR